MAQIGMIGLMAAGTTMQVVGKMREASAAAEQQQYQAQQADAAAVQADENAKISRIGATNDLRNTVNDNRQVFGNIRAAYGASGVTMDGTPQEYLEQQAVTAKANELAVKYQGALKVKAYEDQAASYRSQAGQFRIGATNSREAGDIGAVAKGIGGVTDIMKESGVGFSRNVVLNSKTPKMKMQRTG